MILKKKDKYTTADLQVPWSLTNDRSRPGLKIYCGDTNYMPWLMKGPGWWLDKAASTAVRLDDHQNNMNAKLCVGDILAFTVDASHLPSRPNSNDYTVIVLCDGALIRGYSDDTTGSQPGIAAMNAVPGHAGLYAGKTMDSVQYTACLSSILVHELFHVTQAHFCS